MALPPDHLMYRVGRDTDPAAYSRIGAQAASELMLAVTGCYPAEIRERVLAAESR